MTALPALPSTNMLIGGRTLLFLPSLVKAIGINEAVALQQVRYRLSDERNPHVWQGRRWARASIQRWQERDFPFWERKTVQRTFESLERQGLVLTAQPELAQRDATKWYTINFATLEPLARLVANGSYTRSAHQAAGPAAPSSLLPPLPPSNLLLDEPPLVIIVELAVRVGLDEALLLQQIRYWLADERKPPVRDDRRWVCPRDVDFFVPLTHRSQETLIRLLGRLERAGFLIGSSRYNTQPGDRTKWYTLDFEAIKRLTTEQIEARVDNLMDQTDEMSLSIPTQCPDPAGENGPIHMQLLSRSTRRQSPKPIVSADQVQAVDLIQSLKDSETDPQTDPQIQQQQNQENIKDVVVELCQGLVKRGITLRVAKHLCDSYPNARIAHQTDIYDWWCMRELDAPNSNPGRLVRMIEDDWQPHRDYVSSQERAQADAAHTEARAVAIVAAQERHAEMQARRAEREHMIRELGLDEAQQQQWRGLVAKHPILPSPFHETLFRPPTVGTTEPALVIAMNEERLARLQGSGHRASRATVAARLAILYRNPLLVVVYFSLPALRVAMGLAEPT